MLIPVGCNLSDPQFLYIDLVALLPLSIFQAWTGAYDELTPDVPTATLFYMPVILSVAGSGVIQFANQLYWFLNVQKQPFYTEPFTIGAETIGGSNILSYEDTVLFQISVFQYVVTAIAFSIAKPFRKPIYTNLPYLLSVIFIIAVNFAFLFLPNYNTNAHNIDGSDWLINFFLLEPYTKDGVSFYGYRFWILAGIVVNSVMTLVFEKLLVSQVTKHCDDQAKTKRDQEFSTKMRSL